MNGRLVPRWCCIPATLRANCPSHYRYFEAGPVRFGGGADLTPIILCRGCSPFHSSLLSDAHHPEYYPVFKRWCDEYFYLKHRQENRGVVVFFDYQDGQGQLYRGPQSDGAAAIIVIKSEPQHRAAGKKCLRL